MVVLRNKNAVIYGAAGAIGGAVARAFAREGARVFLTGRTSASLKSVAKQVVEAGGAAETALVDALDEGAIENHLDTVVTKGGRIDISFNAVGFEERQRVPLTDISLDDFAFPIMAWTRTVFLTSRAAARRMTKEGSGVIFTVNAPAGNEAPGGGFQAACAAVLSISRTLATEVAPYGVRVLCLQPNPIPESDPLRRSVARCAGGNDVGFDLALATVANATLLRRLPMLEEVANVAAFLASDQARVMTATVVKLNFGSAVS